MHKLPKPFWIREADGLNTKHGSKNYSYENKRPIFWDKFQKIGFLYRQHNNKSVCAAVDLVNYYDHIKVNKPVTNEMLIHLLLI